MDQRLRFVARLLKGEKMAELCREFDISRKTGYKIFHRYREWSLGPHDLFHAGHQHALAVLFQRDRQRFAGALVDDPGLRNGYGWKMRSRDVA